MMQTQWPGLGPSLDFSALDTPLGGDGGYLGTPGALARSQLPDGVTRPWWANGTGTGSGTGNGGNLFGVPFGGGSASNGSIAGILTGLVSLLQQLVGSFLNQNATQPAAQQQQQPCAAAGGRQQRFENVDVSSTGDPHLATVGTREGPGGGAVDAHWDSMSSQNDLVHSTQIDGGYRVSTEVTQPGANGVTWNQSATVHANFDQDAVTMNRDGSFAIYDNGNEVALGKGESAVLSGGETVSENEDGSLLISARSATGGSIATTLRANGQGVDVTTHAHEIAVGGDAIQRAEPFAPTHRAAR
jgi:hypothetical protein